MKFPVKFVIGLVALIVGIVGVIICLVPHYAAPESPVASYVAAVNKGDLGKMAKCTLSPSDLGGLGGLSDMLGDMMPQQSGVVDVKTALEQSFISCPDDAATVQSVELIGCVSGELQSAMGMSGCEVEAIIKITYTDEAGAEKVVVTNESFGVAKLKGSFKITN